MYRGEPSGQPPADRDHYDECPLNEDRMRDYYYIPGDCVCDSLEQDARDLHDEMMFEVWREADL